MNKWQDDKLTKWCVNEMADWWNDKLIRFKIMKWLFEEMTQCWVNKMTIEKNDWIKNDDKLMKWLADEMTQHQESYLS